MVLRTLTLSLLALAACRDATAPVPFPPHAVTLDPLPTIYETWWADMEECSGIRRPMANVEWYYVPFGHPLRIGGESHVGATWLGEPDRVVLLESMLGVGVIVRHEMLHALLQRSGHPALYFETLCGDLLS